MCVLYDSISSTEQKYKVEDWLQHCIIIFLLPERQVSFQTDLLSLSIRHSNRKRRMKGEMTYNAKFQLLCKYIAEQKMHTRKLIVNPVAHARGKVHRYAISLTHILCMTSHLRISFWVVDWINNNNGNNGVQLCAFMYTREASVGKEMRTKKTGERSCMNEWTNEWTTTHKKSKRPNVGRQISSL